MGSVERLIRFQSDGRQHGIGIKTVGDIAPGEPGSPGCQDLRQGRHARPLGAYEIYLQSFQGFGKSR